MSADEETVDVQWVGPMSCMNTLSVIVVSQNDDIIQNISEAIIEVHTKGDFRWKLIVLRSYELLDVANQTDITGRIAIDFVVIAIDTTKMYCLDWVNNVLNQVHPNLRCCRVVLVNAGGLPMNAMAIQALDLIDLKNNNNLDLITANVMKPDDAVFLARRLLKYIEVSMGVKTGIPNINFSLMN